MDDPRECAELAPLLAEVATGAATGHDRALVLRHVASCDSCRRELTEYARVADELLVLAPCAEPPAGFESTVVSRMAATAPPPPRRARPQAWRRSWQGRRPRPARALAAAAALVLVAALGAGSALWQTAPERELGARFRQTLDVAGGRYLAASRITATGTGVQAGTAFLYQGSPSWLVVTLPDAPVPGDYAITLLTRDGNRYLVGVCAVTPTSTTTGYELPMPVADIAGLTFTGPSGVILTATLPR